MSDPTHPNHYQQGELETWDVIRMLGLGYFDGNAVKYISRYRYKGRPVEDLRKAIAYIEKLIEIVEKYPYIPEIDDTDSSYWPYNTDHASSPLPEE